MPRDFKLPTSHKENECLSEAQNAVLRAAGTMRTLPSRPCSLLFLNLPLLKANVNTDYVSCYFPKHNAND